MFPCKPKGIAIRMNLFSDIEKAYTKDRLSALVGWFDEMTPSLSASLLSQGIEPKENALAVVLSANPEGALSELSF